MAKRFRRIEELPNEILTEILSRLNNTKEAVRICTASRRWRNLWKLCRNLDLDFSDKNYAMNDVQRCVDYVLNNHQQGVDLDHLRIAFQYDDCLGIHSLGLCFQEWFKFANRKRVEILNIDLGTTSYQVITGLPLSHWAPPKVAMTLDSWDRLTTLSLKSVLLDDVDVDLLLSKCPNLETLLLENVSFNQLVLKSTNPKLKRLEIQQCWSLKCIHIVSAPNLESLKYVPTLDSAPCACDVQFQHAPKLEAINLGGGQLCRRLVLKLQEYVPHLLKLQMGMDVWCQNCFASDITTVPAFVNNLKQLELRFTSTRLNGGDFKMMDTIITIINSYLGLEKLTLKYEIQKHGHEEFYGDADYGYQRGFSYKSLKNVEVVGWSGFNSEVRFIRYLIHTSPNLEDLALDPTPPHQTKTEWYGRYLLMPKVKCEFAHAARITQRLTDYIRARTLEGEMIKWIS